MWTAPFQLLCSSSGVLNQRQLPTQFPHYGQKYWFLLQPSAAANEVNMSRKPIWLKRNLLKKQSGEICWNVNCCHHCYGNNWGWDTGTLGQWMGVPTWDTIELLQKNSICTKKTFEEISRNWFWKRLGMKRTLSLEERSETLFNVNWKPG